MDAEATPEIESTTGSAAELARSPSARAKARFHQPHRINALSDGVFAIAMTLLALEIRIPEGIGEHDHAAFQTALPELFGGLGIFALAFFVTSQYWYGHHRVMSYVHTVDDRALAYTVTALIGVASLPVAMHLIIAWGQFPESVAITSGMLAITSLLSDRLYRHVLKPEFADIEPAGRRRIVIQPLINTTVYVLSIPLAYLLFYAFHLAPAWSTLIWMLMFFTRPLALRITRTEK